MGVLYLESKLEMAGYGENEGILYCAVLREDQVLSQTSSINGNFLEFSRKVLEKSDNSSAPRHDKATYASGKSVLCNVFVIVFICIYTATCCIICEMVQ